VSQPASPDSPAPAASGPADFAHRLVRWQLQHGRHDLPWQGRDPYRVWLSEIMLQQTQVAVVAQYFPRFVSRFPTVHALAAAGQDAVLAAWSGLGYYQRARNLHRCAQIVVERHGGQLPRTAAQLARLPGIGPSTAAAIAAFCHNERAAILDGNVQRVLCRSHGISDPIPSAAATRRLQALAAALLPDAEHMPAYTQGLMDLGATVCRPRQPRCALCPFHTDCRARSMGDPQRLPVRRPARAARPQRDTVMLWLRSVADGSVLLEKRPPHGVWPGLWSLPQFDTSAQAAAYAAQFGRVLRQTVLPSFRHAFTHFALSVQPVRIDVHVALHAAERHGQWFAARELDDIALPAPVRRLLLSPGEGGETSD
jgi:A/G-specific adenine glycosylase